MKFTALFGIVRIFTGICLFSMTLQGFTSEILKFSYFDFYELVVVNGTQITGDFFL